MHQELRARYSNVCVLFGNGSGDFYNLKTSSFPLEWQVTPMNRLPFDSGKFNRSVFEQKGFKYENGKLFHTSFPDYKINCTREWFNPDSNVEEAVVAKLPDFEPKKSQFVCFASFYYFNLFQENEIQVTCMPRKDPCDQCQNGVCKRQNGNQSIPICKKGQHHLDREICVPRHFCPGGLKEKGRKQDDDDDDSLRTVIITLASIAALMVIVVVVWIACICDQKIKDFTENVKTIPPSLAKTMTRDPTAGYDNPYYQSDGEESSSVTKQEEYSHEIHDILRSTDDIDAASQKTEETEPYHTDVDEEPIFCYPPNPLARDNRMVGKDLVYITIQPLKSSSTDSGIDSSDGSRTRTSSGESQGGFLYAETATARRAVRPSSSGDSGISSLRSTSIDETLSVSEEPAKFPCKQPATIPVVNTVCGGGYMSKTEAFVSTPAVTNYTNKADVGVGVCQGGYFNKTNVNAGNYWSKFKVGNYWAK